MNQTERQVSWLGVGRMGEAMAERLLATAFVCTPVSGNPLVVRSGNLIFAVSGPPAAAGP
jgi:3-hydroxyisobutyrate dehydrogenase-like beta-hydroxyacid dehydrogenase